MAHVITTCFTLYISVTQHKQFAMDLKEKNREIITTFDQGYLMESILERMCNSKGKVAAKAIIEMAVIVANVPPAYRRCDMYTSSGKEQKFNVEITPSSFYHRGSRDSIDGSRSSSRYKSYLSESPSPNAAIKHSGVYPDIVLYTCHKPYWPHMNLVCEVKSGPKRLAGESYAQLVREMLPAMANQDRVFGLLISDHEAWFVSMKLNAGEDKVIGVFCQSYHFLRDFKFDHGELMSLFRVIVKSFELMEDVQEVIH